MMYLSIYLSFDVAFGKQTIASACFTIGNGKLGPRK